jgi:HSP20 family protein
MLLPSLPQWWGKREVSESRRTDSDDPFRSLHREITRAFDDFWRGLEPAAFGLTGTGLNPRADVGETDSTVEVSFELPGLEEKDMEVSIAGGLLTVKAEKKTERETGRTLSERRYGMVQRTLSLPPGVDADQAEARYRNGVLTVVLPKVTKPAQEVRRITVNRG